jgi:hypothetical protein
MWYHLAAAQGHAQASASCESLNLQLTDSELDQGIHRANSFKSSTEAAKYQKATR